MILSCCSKANELDFCARGLRFQTSQIMSRFFFCIFLSLTSDRVKTLLL